MSRTAWRLSDFVRYVALKCHVTANPQIVIPSGVENHDILKDWGDFTHFLKREYKKCSDEPISYSIESYFLSFIQYNIDTSDLNNLYLTPSSIADTRLVLNRDAHWKFKTDDVVMNTVTLLA